jgi:hypothetical protein
MGRFSLRRVLGECWGVIEVGGEGKCGGWGKWTGAVEVDEIEWVGYVCDLLSLSYCILPG